MRSSVGQVRAQHLPVADAPGDVGERGVPVGLSGQQAARARASRWASATSSTVSGPAGRDDRADGGAQVGHASAPLHRQVAGRQGRLPPSQPGEQLAVPAVGQARAGAPPRGPARTAPRPARADPRRAPSLPCRASAPAAGAAARSAVAARSAGRAAAAAARPAPPRSRQPRRAAISATAASASRRRRPRPRWRDGSTARCRRRCCFAAHLAAGRSEGGVLSKRFISLNSATTPTNRARPSRGMRAALEPELREQQEEADQHRQQVQARPGSGAASGCRRRSPPGCTRS